MCERERERERERIIHYPQIKSVLCVSYTIDGEPLSNSLMGTSALTLKVPKRLHGVH